MDCCLSKTSKISPPIQEKTSNKQELVVVKEPTELGRINNRDSKKSYGYALENELDEEKVSILMNRTPIPNEEHIGYENPEKKVNQENASENPLPNNNDSSPATSGSNFSHEEQFYEDGSEEHRYEDFWGDDHRWSILDDDLPQARKQTIKYSSSFLLKNLQDRKLKVKVEGFTEDLNFDLDPLTIQQKRGLDSTLYGQNKKVLEFCDFS